MSALKHYKNVKRCLASRLEPDGWIASGSILVLALSEAAIVFELQQDLKNGSKELVRFTVNAGISLNALRRFSNSDPSQFPLSVEQCHWRCRVGKLMPSPADLWWTIGSEDEMLSRCSEIVLALKEVALPQLKTLAKEQSLLDLWMSDKGQGLTEYERRLYLAKLLIALGRKSEAQDALQAFATASLGKGWELSARTDAARLHDYLK